MNIAVIPARGGSKRIKRKNLLEFCGKPMIAYSILGAKLAGPLFDHIIVSTDDEEIRFIANYYGAETPFLRPVELASDYVPLVPVINHAVKWVQENIGKVDNVCCIYACSPFIQAKALQDAYSMMISKKVSGYTFSATSISFPIQRAFKVKDNGLVEMFESDNYNMRSQDLEQAYQDAGQFCWGSAETYNSEKIFFSLDSMAYLLPRYMVKDIDTYEDWHRAELMYEILKRNGDLA